MRQNIRYSDVTTLLLAKQRAQDDDKHAKMSLALGTLSWLVAFLAVVTALSVYVAWQEGLLP